MTDRDFSVRVLRLYFNIMLLEKTGCAVNIVVHIVAHIVVVLLEDTNRWRAGELGPLLMSLLLMMAIMQNSRLQYGSHDEHILS